MRNRPFPGRAEIPPTTPTSTCSVRNLTHTPGRFVVAGHSSTTPALAELLGGDPGRPIVENYGFDRLDQIVIGTDGTVATSLLRYGPVSGG